MSDSLELTKLLINQSSVTPEDGNCQQIIAERLSAIGFKIENMPFGNVKNLWARRGQTKPLFTFLGHTDVVPPGPVDQWLYPPFTATEKDGYLYGRGAQDMKSNIAAMVTAYERFIRAYPDHRGSLAILITSDEEGPSVNGTLKVIEHLQQRNEKIDWCLVGEPSGYKQVGDIIKIGRRGSLSAKLKIYGKQGHIAYPQIAENPIHRAMPALTELTQIIWDKGNEFFPPTSFQMSNIHAGTGAGNVIPGHLEILCNFRYSPAVTADGLQQRFADVLEKHRLNFSLEWHHSGLPFLTSNSEFLDNCQTTLKDIVGVTPELSTSGGTSDGRFVAPTGADVVEFGVCNDTIHQINERVKITEIDLLSEVYEKLLIKLLT